MRILIINGPNLNLIGSRETGVYGTTSFESYFEELSKEYAEDGVYMNYVQSNMEGDIVTYIQQADGEYEGIVLNAGGYSHTSVAIADAIRAIVTPVVEVHISNIFAREEYRHTSFTGAACKGSISGLGLDSYRLAVESFRAIK